MYFQLIVSTHLSGISLNSVIVSLVMRSDGIIYDPYNLNKFQAWNYYRCPIALPKTKSHTENSIWSYKLPL